MVGTRATFIKLPARGGGFLAMYTVFVSRGACMTAGTRATLIEFPAFTGEVFITVGTVLVCSGAYMTVGTRSTFEGRPA